MSNTILTVDDSATMRNMISFTLRSAGHEVVQAADGHEALKLIQTRPINLMITDVNMPNMDGISLIRQVRSLPGYQSTPILLLTTESAPEKKAAGRAAGATGWIVKPFQQEQLLAVVAKVLPN